MILSIETSTTVCSVAIHDDQLLLGHTDLFLANSHGEKLAILIRDLLISCNLSMNQLDAVAVSSGPGSYTGLRIGLSTAKGICFSCDIPLISVNTLDAMALSVRPFFKTAWLCPMIDARRMEIYCQIWDDKNNLVLPPTAKIIDEHSFCEELAQHQIVFFGDGAEKCLEAIQNKNSTFLSDIHPSGRFIGKLALQKYKDQSFENLAYFEPGYLKEYKATKPKNMLT